LTFGDGQISAGAISGETESGFAPGAHNGLRSCSVETSHGAALRHPQGSNAEPRTLANPLRGVQVADASSEGMSRHVHRMQAPINGVREAQRSGPGRPAARLKP